MGSTSGFIGSWLVMRLMEHGYMVRATVRDYPANMEKVKHLVELEGAKAKLSLWKADLAEEGSFDESIKGFQQASQIGASFKGLLLANELLHTQNEIRTPDTYLNGLNEVIKPTINGLIDIMKACLKAKTVRRLMFISSAGTVDVTEQQKPLIDETCWSVVDFYRRVKMTSWMYFVSKTLPEQEACEFAKGNNIDFISIIPPVVVGPFLMPTMPPSLISYHCSFTHHRFRDIPDELDIVIFSSKKIKELVMFQFKYSLDDMFTEAVETCRQRGLLPKPAESPINNGTPLK